jgi:hypothetical protein
MCSPRGQQLILKKGGERSEGSYEERAERGRMEEREKGRLEERKIKIETFLRGSPPAPRSPVGANHG